jgi:TonB family protein
MLKSDLNRRPVTPRARALIVIALVAVTLPIAGFAQNTFATLSGSIVDQLDGVLPAVSVVVTDTQRQVTHEARTDRTGRFEFVGLPQGDYLLEASIPGFKTSQTRLTLAGQDMQRDLRLQIGSLQEMVTVTDGPDRSVPRPARAPYPTRPQCAPLGSGGIGGNIRQPVKLKHFAPIYPGGNAQGVVVLATLIGTDGLIKDVKVLRSPNPVLTEAAVDAVRQWEFDQTLLNCVPVETEMSVTVEFRRQ